MKSRCFLLALVAPLLMQCSGEVAGPTFQLAAERPGISDLNCIFISDVFAGSSPKISSSMVRGRSLSCLGLTGDLHGAFSRDEALSGAQFSAASGQHQFEFFGLKTIFGDCGGRSLAELLGYGEVKLYSLGKASVKVGETSFTSLASTYQTGVSPDLMESCLPTSYALVPIRLFVGNSPGDTSINWNADPGGSFPILDGSFQTMAEIPVSFPLRATSTTANARRAQVDAIFALPSHVTSSFSALFKATAMGSSGNTDISDCALDSSNLTAGNFEVGYFSNYGSNMWLGHPGTAIAGGVQNVTGPTTPGYLLHSIGGTSYFHMSIRSKAATGSGACSVLKLDKIILFVEDLFTPGGRVPPWTNS